MFRNIVQNMQNPPGPADPDREAQSTDQSPSINLMRLMRTENFGLQMGAGLLMQAGIISEELLQKLKKIRPDPNALRILSALEDGNPALAREIALDQEFIQSSPKFVQSGDAIRASVKAGHPQLATELIQAGYSLPHSLIIEGYRDQDFDFIQAVISEGLYIRGRQSLLDLWYLFFNGRVDEAHQLLAREPELNHFTNHHNLENQDGIYEFVKDSFVLNRTIKIALLRDHDTLASYMLTLNHEIISKDIINLAIDHNCLDFLKKVWTGNFEVKDAVQITKRQKKSALWEKLGNDLIDVEERRDLAKILKVTHIIDRLLHNGRVKEVEIVLTWPGAVEEPGIIRTLMKHQQEVLTTKAIKIYKLEAFQPDMTYALESEFYDLCVQDIYRLMLQSKEAPLALYDDKVQQSLIKLLRNGETCMQAMNMLSFIPNRNWVLDYTKELVATLTQFAKKSFNGVCCKYPLLFCALTAEFMTRLANASLQHQNRCLAVAEIYQELGISIQDAIKDEQELRYFINQTDAKGRNVLTIYSKNRFYNMLENDEIGTIVGKKWAGNKKHYGLINASTVYKSFIAPSASEEAMQFTTGFDKTKPYMFHYEQWVDSCSLRFLAQACSSLTLLIFYNLVIFTAIESKSFENVADDPEAVVYLRIAQVWIIGIIVEHFLNYLFGMKTGRGFELDNWRTLDLIMLGTMIALMAGMHENTMGKGNTFENIDPVMFNAGMHSVQILIIWLRFMSVLLASKTLGPFLRMIYLMIGQTITFLVLFFCLLICMAAIFTSLFNEDGENYVDFSTSSRYLYGAALGGFALEEFSQNKELGGFLLGAYMLMANVLLLNLLIALLSNIYNDIIARVDSEYRSVVIQYFDRWQWDHNYGMLILLPSPFSYFVLLISPVIMFAKDPRPVNNVLSKILYICYAVPQYVVYLAESLIFMPLLYLKGFVIFGKHGFDAEHPVPYNPSPLPAPTPITSNPLSDNYNIQDEISHKKIEYKLWRSIVWLFIGIPWILLAIARDTVDFFSNLYTVIKDSEEEQDDTTKAQDIVDFKFMINLQAVLKNITAEKVSVSDLVEAWMMFDQIESRQDFAERKQLATDYFAQFADSTKQPIIHVERMRKLLPRQKGKLYNAEYLEVAKHVNVPWVLKGIKKYQETIGAVILGGQAIPKDIGVGGGPLDVMHMKSVDGSIKELESRYIDMERLAKGIQEQLTLQKMVTDRLPRPAPEIL